MSNLYSTQGSTTRIENMHKVIIPSNRIENCNLADQFPSPHSDRFVLRFPSSAAVAISEKYKNEINEVNSSDTVESINAQILEQNSQTADDIAIQPNQFPSVTNTLYSNISKNMTVFDPVSVPSPMSACGSESLVPSGRWIPENAAKKKLP